MSNTLGIDVSNNNGLVNWEYWKPYIKFAGIKCTEDVTFVDEIYPQNMRESQGIYRFPYHYGHPAGNPTAQAKFFVNAAKPEMAKTDHFALDLEITEGLEPVDVSFWAWTFLTEVNRLAPGHRCLVYSYPNFIESGNCARLGSWHLWLADYLTAEPAMPLGPWKSWAFWQYAAGGIDRDMFNGDETTLSKFCESTGPEGP